MSGLVTFSHAKKKKYIYIYIYIFFSQKKRLRPFLHAKLFFAKKRLRPFSHAKSASFTKKRGLPHTQKHFLKKESAATLLTKSKTKKAPASTSRSFLFKNARGHAHGQKTCYGKKCVDIGALWHRCRCEKRCIKKSTLSWNVCVCVCMFL